MHEVNHLAKYIDPHTLERASLAGKSPKKQPMWIWLHPNSAIIGMLCIKDDTQIVEYIEDQVLWEGSWLTLKCGEKPQKYN